MKRMKRAWAAMLALLMLVGCGYQRTEPLPYPEPAASEPEKTIAYVPLDDRPDNVERVVYLAKSLGYAVAMPEAHLYQTRLDHQPTGEGFQNGDTGAIYEWLLEQEAAGCDRYVLSLDQVLLGGLVSSRVVRTGYPTRLSDGSFVLDDELLTMLLEALSADPDNRVWLLDSVMRLAASTVGFQGGTVEEYNALRDYGARPRKTLEGEDLTFTNVHTSYRYGPDGEPLPEPEGVNLDHYLMARGRKLLLSDQAQRTLAQPGYENFHLLIGIDDSSLEDCIQKNEIAYLRQGLRTGADGEPMDWILSGVDDLAFKAVARLCLDETGWAGCGVSVQYFGGTEDRPACEYDFQPLTEIMAEHFDFFGLAEREGAELQILVLTQPADEAQKDAYVKQLMEALKENRKKHYPTILIDAGNGTYGTQVYDALTKQAELGYLIAYSGMLDMAIVTGTALSHGAARYAVLKNGGGTDYMDRAWARTLADSILKDFCYKGVVRNGLLAYIRNDLGGDPNNFWSPALDLEDLLERLENGMEQETAAVIKNLERSSLITSLEPYGEKHWGGVALENYRFPWDRAFEIGMDIRLGELR